MVIKRVTRRRWLHWLIQQYLTFPTVMRVGLLIFAVGGGLDMVYHVAMMASLMLDPFLGPDGMYAHLVTLLGMAVTLVGVFATGLRRRPACSPEVEGGDAHVI